MLKVIIVILLAAMILSLVFGAAFFFKDQGDTRRTLYMLGIRITLAVLLVGCLIYGVFTGQLAVDAPWQHR